MANGYCTPILKHISAVGLGDPAKKLTPLGFTQMLLCCMDGSVTDLNEGTEAGHQRAVTVKYRERVPESAVSDSDTSCEIARTPAYKEFTLPELQTSSVSFAVPESLIRQYCKDASDMVPLGRESRVMREVYSLIIEHAAALFKKINTTLVTQMSTKFGTNVATGTNTATALTFPAEDAMMKSIITKILSQVRENEFCDDFCVVGNGPFADFEILKAVLGNSSAAGIDAYRLGQLIPRVWSDKATKTVWGENQIGVFEKGSLALVTRDKYVGAFAGKHANTERFTMALPTNDFECPQECLDKLLVDVKIREVDCPETMTIDGVESQFSDGVVVTLSKEYSLFVKPSTLFAEGDELEGTNGTLRYSVSEAAPAATH